jgi:hypothetical protein
MRIAKEFGQHLNTVDEIGRLIHLSGTLRDDLYGDLRSTGYLAMSNNKGHPHPLVCQNNGSHGEYCTWSSPFKFGRLKMGILPVVWYVTKDPCNVAELSLFV